MMTSNTKTNDAHAFGTGNHLNSEQLFIEKMLEKFQEDDQLKHFLKKSEQYLVETEEIAKPEK